jgi:hypothetical protein
VAALPSGLSLTPLRINNNNNNNNTIVMSRNLCEYDIFIQWLSTDVPNTLNLLEGSDKGNLDLELSFVPLTAENL